MYLGNLSKRLTLRLTEDQYDFLTDIANTIGVTPSDYLRMTVNAAMVTMNKKKGTEGSTNEYDKSNNINIL